MFYQEFAVSGESGAAVVVDRSADLPPPFSIGIWCVLIDVYTICVALLLLCSSSVEIEILKKTKWVEFILGLWQAASETHDQGQGDLGLEPAESIQRGGEKKKGEK